MESPATIRARVDVRAWPRLDATAHLVLLDVSMIPTPHEVERWVNDVFDARPGVRSIRTGALFPDAADAFRRRGFDEIDRLTLLARPISPTDPLPSLPSPRRTRAGGGGVRLRSMRRGDLESAATIDAACFEPGWQNDADALRDVCRATPSVRARRAVVTRRDVGFAITGLAGRNGYLQRIAVRPGFRRDGIGRLLVVDALRWLARRGASSALVNTGVDNDAARSMYLDCGFTRRDDELVVLERRR